MTIIFLTDNTTKESHKKHGYFTIRLTVRVPPPPCIIRSVVQDFFVFMIVCVLKRILHKKKIIVIQLQKSLLLLTAGLLQTGQIDEHQRIKFQ